jgi:hypothetical protein
MANINHEVIADPYIHEPKGVASALANKVYVANGTGSGTWKTLSPSSLSGITGNGVANTFVSVDGAGNFTLIPAPHGQVDFFDSTLAAPYTLAATTSYQKIAATTVAGGNSVLMTEGTNSRLTYTGTGSIALHVLYNASISLTGTARDVTLAVFKNGVIQDGFSVMNVSTVKHCMSGATTLYLTTNDYVEIYAKIAVADTINIYSFNINAIVAGA